MACVVLQNINCLEGSLAGYSTLSFNGPPTEVLCLHFFEIFCEITIYGRISLQEEFYETYLRGFQVNE